LRPPPEPLNSAQLVVVRALVRAVNSVCFSPDGSRIASGCNDDTARVWDAVSGEELVCIRGHEGGVDSVAFSPDGQRLASASDHEPVRSEFAGPGPEPLNTGDLVAIRAMVRAANGVCCTPGASRIWSGFSDDTARIWDAVSGQELVCIRGHEGG